MPIWSRTFAARAFLAAAVSSLLLPAALTHAGSSSGAPVRVAGAQPSTGTVATAERVSASLARPAAQTIEVEIEAMDFAFSGPAAIEGGLVTMRLKNSGQEAHHAQLLRLKDGVTPEQLGGALQQNPGAAFALVTFAGGPGAVGPGGMSEVTLSLSEGQYLFICLIPSPDGIAHVAKGMAAPLAVTDSGHGEPLPEGTATVTMRDFGYSSLGHMPAGLTTLHVVNEGPQPHEAAVLRLRPGKSVADILAFFSGPPAGPPPWFAAGGLQGIDAGGAGLMTVHLEPGDYALICNIPDPGSGTSHLQLGMLAGFTVH